MWNIGRLILPTPLPDDNNDDDDGDATDGSELDEKSGDGKGGWEAAASSAQRGFSRRCCGQAYTVSLLHGRYAVGEGEPVPRTAVPLPRYFHVRRMGMRRIADAVRRGI